MTESGLYPTVILWGIRGVALIIERATGIYYQNQTGGHACVQSEMEGVLVPFNHDAPLDAPELETEHRLGKLLENEQQLTPELADQIDGILASSDDTNCVRVDRTRLRKSMEAWVYVDVDATCVNPCSMSPIVGFGKCRGVLTWQNSD